MVSRRQFLAKVGLGAGAMAVGAKAVANQTDVSELKAMVRMTNPELLGGVGEHKVIGNKATVYLTYANGNISKLELYAEDVCRWQAVQLTTDNMIHGYFVHDFARAALFLNSQTRQAVRIQTEIGNAIKIRYMRIPDGAIWGCQHWDSLNEKWSEFETRCDDLSIKVFDTIGNPLFSPEVGVRGSARYLA